MWYTLDNFYTSNEWRDLLKIIRSERVNEEGFNVCEYCGRRIMRAYDCIGHHKEELTNDNVNDVSVSLNSDNVILVHHKCHNIIHDKLGYKRRGVYLVYGSPMAGKRSYVEDVRCSGDIVIDLDSIWQCVTGNDRYIKDNRARAVVFAVRDTLLECVKYRRGKWVNAYIIGGYPLVGERERLCKELGAEEIYIDTSKEECLHRLCSLHENDARACDEYQQYIFEWWEKYTPPLII